MAMDQPASLGVVGSLEQSAAGEADARARPERVVLAMGCGVFLRLYPTM